MKKVKKEKRKENIRTIVGYGDFIINYYDVYKYF